jgi:hypothetical protein
VREEAFSFSPRFIHSLYAAYSVTLKLYDVRSVFIAFISPGMPSRKRPSLAARFCTTRRPSGMSVRSLCLFLCSLFPVDSISFSYLSPICPFAFTLQRSAPRCSTLTVASRWPRSRTFSSSTSVIVRLSAIAHQFFAIELSRAHFTCSCTCTICAFSHH